MLAGFLVGVVFYDLLDGAKGSHNHRDCCCFEPAHSLNLDFQVFVFVKLFRGFDSVCYTHLTLPTSDLV